MKILCDVCEAAEAAVFCCADEAALCPACDRRIHRANKLSDKHIRFPLLYSSSSQPHPLCDICQDRLGFVFCKEDRAILCDECDFPIHVGKRPELMHSRFVLTGTRLSAPIATASSPSSEQRNSHMEVSASFSSIAERSSISDYLIKMLPGYRVEDLLVDDSMNQLAGKVFFKSTDMLPFEEVNPNDGYTRGPPEADWNFIVPNALPQFLPAAESHGGIAELDEEFVHKEASKAHLVLTAQAAATVKRHDMEQCGNDDMFTVPQLLAMPESIKKPCRPSSWYF